MTTKQSIAMALNEKFAMLGTSMGDAMYEMAGLCTKAALGEYQDIRAIKFVFTDDSEVEIHRRQNKLVAIVVDGFIAYDIREEGNNKNLN